MASLAVDLPQAARKKPQRKGQQGGLVAEPTLLMVWVLRPSSEAELLITASSHCIATYRSQGRPQTLGHMRQRPCVHQQKM